METSNTLTTLLQQAESDRDAQQTVLRGLENAAAAAQNQAEQLLAYRAQYQQRWTSQFRQSGTIEVLQAYQGFSLRLDQAIAHQNHSAAQAHTRVQQARAELLAREQRVAAVRKLIERRMAEQQRSVERREQRSTDEFASRRASVSRLTPSMI